MQINRSLAWDIYAQTSGGNNHFQSIEHNSERDEPNLPRVVQLLAAHALHLPSVVQLLPAHALHLPSVVLHLPSHALHLPREVLHLPRVVPHLESLV